MGLFAAMHALTREPAASAVHPEWLDPTIVVLGLAAIPAGLLQWTGRFRTSLPFARRVFLLDVAVVTGLVATSASDSHSYLFALTFPVVIEGAVLMGMAGSLAAAACTVSVYGLFELTRTVDAETIQAVLIRGAAALGVGGLGGTMTRSVHRDRVALRQSEARFRAATENSTDGVVLIDPHGKITFVTPSTAELLGRTADEVIGESVTEFIHPDDLQAVMESLQQVTAAPEATVSNEARARHKDGSWRWLENRAGNQLDDPDIGAIVIHTRDITERKRLEAELAERMADIRLAAEERRRLLARIVGAQEEERAWVADALHDDPIQKLTAALLRVEMVRDSEPASQAHGTLDTVASTLSESIDTLRRLMVQLRSVPLERLGLAPALREHFDRLSTGKARLTIVDSVDDEPEQAVRLVAYRIAQEAIANALKHADAKEVTVTLESREEGLWAEVRDDGRGFDPAAPVEMNHVGLTSMRERAELTGGWCQIVSTPGEGTSVSFWLPSSPA